MTKTRDDHSEAPADLSEAARAAVRDAGDPRIDAHLAALGLGPDPAPVMEPEPVAAPEEHAAEVATLEARADGAEAALATARRRTRALAAALGIALVADLVLVLLLVGRPA